MAKRRYSDEMPRQEGGMTRPSVTGMERREFYAGADNKRGMEKRDGEMLNEDRSAIANMPPYIKMTEYPRTPYLGDSGINDSWTGVDEQMRMDHADMMKGLYPKKY